jgi:RNA polymerase sigma factor (TIGR02999 family)
MASPPSDSGSADLTTAAYAEIRAIAVRMLRRERRGHTLQPTAVVHEAWLRLSAEPAAGDAASFSARAARVVREVLTDYERKRRTRRRGGHLHRTALADDHGFVGGTSLDLLALDEALNALAQRSPRKARVVELRFFAGLSMREVARELGCSERVVAGEWAFARAWLAERLANEQEAGEAGA